MSDVMINLETGLPELQNENLFWRVDENDYSMFRMTFGGEPQARVKIIESVKVTRKVPNVFFTLFGKWEIGHGEKTVTEIQEVERVSVPIYRYEVGDEDLYNDDDEKIGVKEVRKGFRVSGDDLTPELILEHAKDALKRYNEINVSRAYLGDYPPKKLEN